ncbi:lipopolysaccharide biosynthesis protein [Nitrosomonas sp. Nm132]|jgi:PST family polysaccharide transporter|uniref:lipopolysaccharide biosynthesis protein n=1 Tax=Nitrosomonas sp. Nm132 TaxID=1881053 RepID=UPI00088A4BCD|nr:lipopolysaccharide biosynthesis protein [Nitrosomonas sp. Nm132]SDH17403.1 polysaccharide transporter, PST family [Nitrosomonas sp. Nm132]
MKKSSLTERATAGIVWTLAGTGGQTILKLGVLMILARLLTPAEFGVVGAAVVAITFLGIFGKLGVAQALVQIPELTRDHLVAGFHLSLGLGLFAGLAVYLGASLVETLFQIEQLAEPIAIMALLLPLTGLQQVSEARIQRDLKFRILAMEQVASYGIGYGGVAIMLALMGYGVWALVGGILGQGVIRAMIMMAIRPPILGIRANRTAYRDLLRFGGGHALAEIGRTGAYQVDNLIVGRFLGAEALGLYGRAFQVVTMPTKLLGVGLLKVMFPIMSRMQSEADRLARAFLRSMGMVAMLGLPFSMLLALLAPEIVHVLLGSQWIAVIIPFQILAACIVFRVGHKLCEALVRARGAVYRLAWTQWLYMGMVSLGAYLGHFLGLEGVAAGVAVAVTLNFMVVFMLVSSLSGLSLRALGEVLLRHLVIALVVVGVAAIGLVLLRAAALNEIVRLVVVSGSVLLLYGMIWLVRPAIFAEEGELLRSLLGKRFSSKQKGNLN